MTAFWMALLVTSVIFALMFGIMKIFSKNVQYSVDNPQWETSPRAKKIESIVASSLIFGILVAMVWFMYEYVLPVNK